MTRYLIPVFAAAALLAEPLSQGERDFAMSELHATRKQFLDSIVGLSDAQWNYKPGPDRWSIAEVAEHIATAEDAIRQLVATRVMQSPADPSKRDEVKGKEQKLAATITDRSQKAQAPEFLQPAHRWKDQATLAAHFRQSRDSAIEYLQTTNDGLRDHFLPHPAAGLLDAYQWFVLIAEHTARHVKQIEEVKASPGYPRS